MSIVLGYNKSAEQQREYVYQQHVHSEIPYGITLSFMRELTGIDTKPVAYLHNLYLCGRVSPEWVYTKETKHVPSELSTCSKCLYRPDTSFLFLRFIRHSIVILYPGNVDNCECVTNFFTRYAKPYRHRLTIKNVVWYGVNPAYIQLCYHVLKRNNNSM